MNKEQKHSPKYWVVHEKESTDVFVVTMSKSRNNAVYKFLTHCTHGLIGTVSDEDLEEWWENQTEFVCSLIEIKLVEV